MRVRRLKVKDGKILNIEKYPNFSATGSIKGMKDKFYGKDDGMYSILSSLISLSLEHIGKKRKMRCILRRTT